VLELIRHGLTNEQIARRLGLTVDGAKYHVSEIITKLGVSGREEAAAWAVEKRAPRLSALAPFAWLAKKATSGAVLKVAAGGSVVVALGAVSLLALALILSDRTEPELIGTSGSLGKLAYIRDGDLWVKVVPDGTPRRLTSDGKASYPRWSPSGEYVLVGEKVVGVNGGSRVAQGCVAWSLASDRLACVTADDKIRLEDADGGNVVQFDPAPLVQGIDARSITRLGPYWSPHGTNLAYVLDAPLTSPGGSLQPRYSGLWLVNASGGGARELLNNQDYPEAGQIGVFDWHEDTLLLLFNPMFSASIPNDGLPLHALSLAGGAPRRLNEYTLPRAEMFGGISSSGSAILLTEGGRRETWTRKRIAVTDVRTGNLTYLTGAESAAVSPAWSPDGRRIAYVAAADIEGIGGGDPARQILAARRLFVMDSDGSNKQQLTYEESYRDERPLWSPDGSHLLFARLDNAEDGASAWLFELASQQAVKVADLSLADAPNPPLWFGFYGYIAWDQFFAWWTGS
jgi:Tol biopolymer transport system component